MYFKRIPFCKGLNSYKIDTGGASLQYELLNDIEDGLI